MSFFVPSSTLEGEFVDGTYVIAFGLHFGIGWLSAHAFQKCWKSTLDLSIRFPRILMWALGLNTPDCTTSGLSRDSSIEGEGGAGGAGDLVSDEFWRRFPGNWRPHF